jgi:hypothetical protein
VHQNILNLVCLFNLDAYPYAVDAWLDQDSLILIARDSQRGQENLGRCLRLYFWDIVSLGRLGSEVGKAKRGCQTASYSLEVRSERLGLFVGRKGVSAPL